MPYILIDQDPKYGPIVPQSTGRILTWDTQENAYQHALETHRKYPTTFLSFYIVHTIGRYNGDGTAPEDEDL